MTSRCLLTTPRRGGFFAARIHRARFPWCVAVVPFGLFRRGRARCTPLEARNGIGPTTMETTSVPWSSMPPITAFIRQRRWQLGRQPCPTGSVSVPSFPRSSPISGDSASAKGLPMTSSKAYWPWAIDWDPPSSNCLRNSPPPTPAPCCPTSPNGRENCRCPSNSAIRNGSRGTRMRRRFGRPWKRTGWVLCSATPPCAAMRSTCG